MTAFGPFALELSSKNCNVLIKLPSCIHTTGPDAAILRFASTIMKADEFFIGGK